MSNSPLRFEVVVVGAGPAGLAAACAAAENGRRTALVDETPWLGGQIWRGQKAHPTIPEAAQWVARFSRTNATFLDQSTILASGDGRTLLAEHPSGPRVIQWERLILATGARELFLPFPGWTLPGNFGPGGLQSLAKHGWPVAGKRIVLAGSGPLLLAVGAGLRALGATIVSINEQAPLSRVISFGTGLLGWPAKLAQAARLKWRLLGTPFRCGVWPVAAAGQMPQPKNSTEGNKENEETKKSRQKCATPGDGAEDGADPLRAVTLTDGRRQWREDCDFLACGFGLVPNLELPLALGCQIRDEFARVDEWQASSVAGVYCAGELTGIGGTDAALVEGEIAGLAAAGRTEAARRLFARRAAWKRFAAALARTFALRDELALLARPDTMVCRCEDVRFERMKSFTGWREAKLQTRCGMGSCQGRVCGAAAKVLFGWGMESVRPPVLPGRVESLCPGAQGRVS